MKDNLSKIGLTIACLGIGLLFSNPAYAIDITTDVITPMTTISTGADDTAGDLAPVGMGMFGFGAIATVAKRIIYSA